LEGGEEGEGGDGMILNGVNGRHILIPAYGYGWMDIYRGRGFLSIYTDVLITMNANQYDGWVV